jgi:hypothetical protein
MNTLFKQHAKSLSVTLMVHIRQHCVLKGLKVTSRAYSSSSAMNRFHPQAEILIPGYISKYILFQTWQVSAGLMLAAYGF